MQPKRKLGPNMEKLLIRRIAVEAVPSGGGLSDGIKLFTEPGRLKFAHRTALAWVDEAISLIRSSSDNPYGDDEETIAGAILILIKAREQG